MKDFIPLIQTLLWVGLIIIVAALFRNEIRLFREALVKRLVNGNSIEIGPIKLGEIRKELDSVRGELNDTNLLISQLFLTTMSQTMFDNLKKLETGCFGSYKMSLGLERELYHLRDIGYIEVPSIKAIPESGDDLSKHIKITPTGKQFVALRASIIEKSKSV